MSLSASTLSRLEYQHLTIRDLIGNTPENDLRRNVHPGKWSAFENIAHLAAYQPIFQLRLERMQAENDPEFERYVAADDPQFATALTRSLGELLIDIDEKRSILIAELKGMDDQTLARTGLHPRYGRFAISDWTEFFLLHEAHHLYTIFMLVRDLQG